MPPSFREIHGFLAEQYGPYPGHKYLISIAQLFLSEGNHDDKVLDFRVANCVLQLKLAF